MLFLYPLFSKILSRIASLLTEWFLFLAVRHHQIKSLTILWIFHQKSSNYAIRVKTWITHPLWMEMRWEQFQLSVTIWNLRVSLITKWRVISRSSSIINLKSRTFSTFPKNMKNLNVKVIKIQSLKIPKKMLNSFFPLILPLPTRRNNKSNFTTPYKNRWNWIHK